MPAVECQNLSKTYGKGEEAVQALRSIDLSVNQGEIFMLAGPSGCGKTTLISIIAGILDLSGGVCKVLDHDFSTMSKAKKTAFRAENVGFVFQSYNLFPALTAAENVAVPLLINRVKRSVALKRASEYLEKVGLGHRTKSLPSQLSGGQQQRVAIARALIHNPRLIICDEPTAALDNETGQNIMRLLQSEVSNNGCTLIIVTHDSRIFGYAQRIAHLSDGTVTNIEG